MIITMLMASNSKVMGRFVITRKLKFLGWLGTMMMAFAVVVMFYTLLA
jgi:Mn2+/Fe2+ NRAMP family transporter